MLVILCGGILVLFTDVEQLLVRWVNCGPIATDAQKSSQICR
ncbi:putative conserved membrane protein [Synechococcus sp. A18-40]|nr:putative conserved membrane protein [Synechococcus sp. A18-40]